MFYIVRTLDIATKMRSLTSFNIENILSSPSKQARTLTQVTEDKSVKPKPPSSHKNDINDTEIKLQIHKEEPQQNQVSKRVF